MATNPITVAIDGPSGVGKSTVARLIAKSLSIPYVDSGSMYRCVALVALRRGVALDACPALEKIAREIQIRYSPDGARLYLMDEEVTETIRDQKIGMAASTASRCPELRRVLVDLQRTLAKNGAVMEGRDIGSVVLPGATIKVYLDATVEERVRRRVRDLEKRGTPQAPELVAEEMRKRDASDTQRKEAPLVRLPEAFYLDSTRMSAEDTASEILQRLKG